MKYQFFHQKRKGLTLVELLIAMTVLSVVIALTLSVLFNAQKTQKQLDKKYEVSTEINRVTKRIEKSLIQAEKLISGTKNAIKFLGSSGDTVEYYVKGDTLYKNDQPLTMLSIDSLRFGYVKIKNKKKVTDFFSLDDNSDGILDHNELRAISGIEVNVQFLITDKSEEHRIKKHLFILLRNIQSF